MHVRPRIDADLDQLVEIATEVQALDGYPGKGTATRSFLVSKDALGAWVAEHDGDIVGHVALHRSSLPVVMELASEALGLRSDELAVVARLLVAPSARRHGVGRLLLEHAADDARARDLHPILDVLTAYTTAHALYDSCGWRNIGEVTMHFSDGAILQSYVYLAP